MCRQGAVLLRSGVNKFKLMSIRESAATQYAYK